MNEDTFATQSALSQSQIHVLGEHPTYEFNIGEIIAVVSSDNDPFWLAQITEINDEGLVFQYFHHNTPKQGSKMNWKLHNTNGFCGITDVYTRFKLLTDIFTKSNSIRTAALRKISQACMKYNAQLVPDNFK